MLSRPSLCIKHASVRWVENFPCHSEMQPCSALYLYSGRSTHFNRPAWTWQSLTFNTQRNNIHPNGLNKNTVITKCICSASLTSSVCFMTFGGSWHGFKMSQCLGSPPSALPLPNGLSAELSAFPLSATASVFRWHGRCWIIVVFYCSVIVTGLVLLKLICEHRDKIWTIWNKVLLHVKQNNHYLPHFISLSCKIYNSRNKTARWTFPPRF